MNTPQVGDKVVILGSFRDKRIDTVTKVTKTQVTVSTGMRFLISTNRNVGATQWHRYYYSVVSPEKAEELEREWHAEDRKKELVHALQKYRWQELELTTLEWFAGHLEIE